MKLIDAYKVLLNMPMEEIKKVAKRGLIPLEYLMQIGENVGENADETCCDISPETFIAVKNLVAVNLGRSSCKTIIEDVFNSLKTATPIPDNVTHGETMEVGLKALFPKTIFLYNCNATEGYRTLAFSDEWWNAPYKKGGTE